MAGVARLQGEADNHGQQCAQHPDQLQLCLELGEGAPEQCRRHVPLCDRVERRLGCRGREADGEGEEGVGPPWARARPRSAGGTCRCAIESNEGLAAVVAKPMARVSSGWAHSEPRTAAMTPTSAESTREERS